MVESIRHIGGCCYCSRRLWFKAWLLFCCFTTLVPPQLSCARGDVSSTSFISTNSTNKTQNFERLKQIVLSTIQSQEDQKEYLPGDRPSKSTGGTLSRFVVLSAARSGSGWLVRMLDSHPSIVCKNHEPLGQVFDAYVHPSRYTSHAICCYDQHQCAKSYYDGGQITLSFLCFAQYPSPCITLLSFIFQFVFLFFSCCMVDGICLYVSIGPVRFMHLPWEPKEPGEIGFRMVLEAVFVHRCSEHVRQRSAIACGFKVRGRSRQAPFYVSGSSSSRRRRRRRRRRRSSSNSRSHHRGRVVAATW